MTHPRLGMFPLGLVVGKFAPLHLGHEWLVQQAALRCERLLVLSYTKPEFDRCGVVQRRQWLTARFPDHECLVVDDAWLTDACQVRGIVARPMPLNNAADAIQQDWLAWLLGEVLDRQPDAMFCSEDYGPSCAQTLSRAFGKDVVAVLVDRERMQVPISASAIRESPGIVRRWAAPEVAASFVRRVVLLGGESSGKTTLAEALARQLNTNWVAEYGRELWELQGGLKEPDLLKIASEQVRREEQATRSAGAWLVCDTSPLTTFGYSHWMYGRAASELDELALRPYDACILCEPDFPFIQDGTRQEEGFRYLQHVWYVERLTAGSTPWLAVGGPVAQRTAKVASWLERL